MNDTGSCLGGELFSGSLSCWSDSFRSAKTESANVVSGSATARREAENWLGVPTSSAGSSPTTASSSSPKVFASNGAYATFSPHEDDSLAPTSDSATLDHGAMSRSGSTSPDN